MGAYLEDSQIRSGAVTQQLDNLCGAGNSDIDVTTIVVTVVRG